MIVSYNGINSNVLKFAEFALEKAKVKYNQGVCQDYDLDRVYLDIDGKEYDIRTWNINEKGIRYSVFDCSGDSSIELYHGYVSHFDYCG